MNLNAARWALLLVLLLSVAACDPSAPAPAPGGTRASAPPAAASSNSTAAPGGTGAAAPPAATSAASSATAEAGLWGCTMCPEVQSRTPGTCPKCGMPLVIRHGTGAFICLEHAEDGAMDLEPGVCRFCGKALEPAITRVVYACSTHENILAGSKGVCPVCNEELRAQRMAVVWACDDHGLAALDPGRCGTCGKELVETLLALPHGDHNPKHGGIFFMAPDRWHHLEGALAEPDTFRLYLYDNFTRPMPTDGVTGYVRVGRVTAEGDVELAAARHPLEPVKGTTYFETRSAEFDPPLDLALFLDLSGGQGEADRFDFTFTRLSREGAVEESGPPPQVGTGIDIPGSRDEILRAIHERRISIREYVSARRLSLIYRPALEAKELALALATYSADVPADKQSELQGALYQTVRGAWLLDLHGDLGELAKVREAHEVFASGLDRLESLFAASEE